MGRRMSTQPQALTDHESLVAELARAGRAAQRHLARMDDAGKSAALASAASALRAASAQVLAANAGTLLQARRAASPGPCSTG
jgi:glutamate-5-semialdehyde dehydrogenase